MPRPGVQAQYPTLLGTNAWGCYWEWVWVNMGASRHMHNPVKEPSGLRHEPDPNAGQRKTADTLAI